MAKTQGNKKKKILIGTISGVVGLGIVAGVTIPLVMCAPKSQVDVTFDADGQEGVTFEGETHIKVNEGTTFEEVRSKIVAKKVVSGTTYPFSHWYKKGDSSKSRIADTFKVNESITVCPAFEQEPVPVEDFQIFFTAAPGEQGVKISAPSKTIKKGQTFAKVKNEVTATKTTTLGKWQFQWWYKDGDSPEHKMVDDVVLGNDPSVKSLTVHPYFLPPVAKYVVTFSDGGDPNVHFNKSQLTYTATDGTTLESLLSSSGIEATKTIDGKPWTFKHWSQKLTTELPWEKPLDFGKGSKITENITLYPYFEEPKDIWTNKTISWETFADGTPANKTFTLPPLSEDATSTDTTISNFILTYDGESELIPELQEGEEIIVIPTKQASDLYNDVNIIAEVLPQSQDTAPNKINIKFTFENLPTDNILMYSTPLKFDIDLSLLFDGTSHPQDKIEGITINFSDPWDAPKFDFTGAEVQTNTLKTNPGSKKFVIDHENTEIGHFTISRPLDNREKLEVNVLGNNAENLTAEAKVIPVGNGNATIDIGVSFNQIDGIFVEHKADFQLEFVTTFEGSGREEKQKLDDNFQLVYTPDAANPYNIVMDDTIVIDGDLGENSFAAQIENSEIACFETQDYLTIRNITREELTEPSEIDQFAPIYFTSPHEVTSGEIIGDSSQIALQGNDQAINNIGFKILFHGEEPTEIQYYTVKLQLDFWTGDPDQGKWIMDASGGHPDNVPEGVEHYDTIEREITFVYSPRKWINYTSADWAQYRSVIISMSAKNTETGKYEQKLGTAWVLSNISNNGGFPEQYYVTSYNVKQDYLTLKGEGYEDFSFRVSNMGAARQYVANDTTKYIIVDEDINSEGLSYMPTDMIIYNNQDSEGKYYVDWVDQHRTIGTEDANLYWNWRGAPYYINDLLGPSLALFKIKMEGLANSSSEQTFNETFKHRSQVLYFWALAEGLDPLSTIDDNPNDGQISSLFKTVPEDFNRDGFSYGYTGGFKSKIIPYGNTMARAVYWTDFVIPSQIGNLAYFDPTGYINCLEYYKELYKVDIGAGEEPVRHVCGSFTMTLNSVSKEDYFDEAGRGAMFLLRKYTEDKKSLEFPLIAGINSNAQSRWNWSSTFTPYFDVWQYGSQQKQNLLRYYQWGWGHE